MPVIGVLADAAGRGARQFMEATQEVAKAIRSRPAKASAQAAVWLAPILGKVAWDVAADRHPEHPGVLRARDAARGAVPLDGAIKVMRTTGRIKQYPGQRIEPGDLPVLYYAVRAAALSAVESAVENAADCQFDVSVALLEGWQPEPGHSSFIKTVEPAGAETLKTFMESVHTQTRHALFTAVEQIIRADFEFFGEGDPNKDPNLQMLRDALDQSEPSISAVSPPMIVGVKSSGESGSYTSPTET